AVACSNWRIGSGQEQKVILQIRHFAFSITLMLAYRSPICSTHSLKQHLRSRIQMLTKRLPHFISAENSPSALIGGEKMESASIGSKHGQASRAFLVSPPP